jgi:hypothetical protein
MGWVAWLQKLAPDFVATGRRFPFPIVLAALTTAVGLALINAPSDLRDPIWERLWAGLATAVPFALAGVMFAESRRDAVRAGVVFKHVLPIVVIALFQVRDIAWLVPWLLPAIGVLWLSISPFTVIGRGPERDWNQNVFWWVNHQAVATAAIATLAFLIIALGLVAIERSLSLLFGLNSSKLFYEWVLPFTGMFLTPVYWLSTIPRVAEYRDELLDRPDFTSTAIGLLGQFVLVPLLLIYAAILLVYTGQIVVTQQLPQGMIGWMVLGFVVTGAATWLVLHPPFMRDKPLVRIFRTAWFWLTLVPLGLFFVAVWVRVDAYGLTTERMLLLAGGIWAALLALLFLVRRGDIRFIPALAALVLALLSFGPWNVAHLPVVNQLDRLDAVVMNAGSDLSASPPRSDWTAEEVAIARGSIDYLVYHEEGRRGVRDLMARYGVTWPADREGSYVVLEAMGVDIPPSEWEQRYVSISRNFDGQPVDVTATPWLIRPVGVYGPVATDTPPLRFAMPAGELRVGPAGTQDADLVPIDTAGWVARQAEPFLIDPWLDFTVAGRNYRLVVQMITLDRGDGGAGPPVLNTIDGQLFSDRAE